MSAVVPLSHASVVRRSEELEGEVAKIWLNIVKHIEDVLAGSKFGFKHFAEWADPSIEDIVESITKIDGLLNAILDGAVGLVSEECENTLMNCQQCMHHIREIQLALKHNNQDQYDTVIRMLTQQRKF